MEKEQFFCASSQAPPSVMPPGMNSAVATANLHAGIYPNLGLNHSMHNSFCFESVVGSLVSSPYFHALAGDGGAVFRELIGQQGCVCNSDAQIPCHNTLQQGRGSLPMPGTAHFSPFAVDPGFANRAARLACFGARNLGDPMPKEVAGNSKEGSSAPQETELSNSHESSSTTDMTPAGGAENNSRKRKAGGKSRGKTSPLPSCDTNPSNEAEEQNSEAKRRKTEQRGGGGGGGRGKESNAKPPEPPKDYIHVRARRGQATDSHSLAERVRREKISERMKQLQDLVPGCSKITGKALLLDEIINYVQSLQRQVELLSTKLATLNPQLDINMAAQLRRDMPREHGAPPLARSAFSYAQPPRRNLDMHPPLDPLDSFDGFAVADATCQLGNQWGDDLECVVQMGFVQER